MIYVVWQLSNDKVFMPIGKLATMAQTIYGKGDRVELYRTERGELIIPALPIGDKIRAEGLKEAIVEEDHLNMVTKITLKFRNNERTYFEVERAGKYLQEVSEP